MEKNRRLFNIWPILIIAGIFVYIFRDVLFPPFSSWVLSRESGDVSTIYYYWRSFGFESLKTGIMPLWNPDIFCGVPFAAYPESAIFYPFNLIFFFLSLPTALNLSFVLHLILLAVFQYYWLRFIGSGCWSSLLGSLVLVFSGPVILHLTAGHLSNICTMAWVPLLFLSLEGFFRSHKFRWSMVLGFIIGIQLLAGHWQYVYYSILGIAAYGLGRLIIIIIQGEREWKFLAGGAAICIVIALGMAAIQILPAVEVADNSFRKNLDINWAAAFSLPPINLITFIFPGYLGDTINSLYWGRYYFWEMCGYLGFIPIVLALFSLIFRKDRVAVLLAILAAGALLTSLGAYTPFFKLLYNFFPGFRYFRGSAKLLFLAAFFISTMAARGADCLTAGNPPRKNNVKSQPAWRFSPRAARKVFWAGAAIIFLISLAVLTFSYKGNESPPQWWREQLKNELLRGPHYDIVPPGQPAWWRQLMVETPPEANYPAYIQRLVRETPFPENSWRLFRGELSNFGWICFFFAVLLVGAGLIRRRSPITALIAILAAGELIIWARPYITGFDSRVCLWPEEIKKYFHNQNEPFRYLSIDPADYNRGMLDGFSSILGYQADATRRYLEYINVSQGLPPQPRELVPVITGYSPLLDLMNTRYLLTPPDMTPGVTEFKRELSTGEKSIWSNHRAIPRTLLAKRVKIITAPMEILKYLKQSNYNPTEEVILEEMPPEIFLQGSADPGKARIEKYGPQEITIRAELSSPGVLLLNDSYANGWKAYLNEKEEKIYRANYLMRAICLEAGKHVIRFVYQPISFFIGTLISLSTAVTILILFAVFIFQRHHRAVDKK